VILRFMLAAALATTLLFSPGRLKAEQESASAGMRGLLGPGMKMFGIVHDDPDVTPEDKIRYDAAVAVSRPVSPDGEFGVMELAGGRYAVATHRGPYAELGKTYQRIYGAWLPKSGYELRDAPAFEQYLNSPQSAKPEDLLTLIHVPIAG